MMRTILLALVLGGLLVMASACSNQPPAHRHEMSIGVQGSNSD